MSRDRHQVDEWVNRLPLTYRFPRSVEEAFGPGHRHVDAIQIQGEPSDAAEDRKALLGVGVVALVLLLVFGVMSMTTRPASQTRALIQAQEGLQCVPDALPPGYTCTVSKEPMR